LTLAVNNDGECSVTTSILQTPAGYLDCLRKKWYYLRMSKILQDHEVEHIPLRYDAAFPFCCRNAPTHPDRGAHMHPCAELIIITAGTAVHFGRFATHRVTRGDVFVIAGPCYHGYRNTDALALINIQFDPALFLPRDAALRAMPGFKKMFGMDAPGARVRGFFGHTHLTSDQFKHVVELAWHIKNECALRQPGYALVVDGFFRALVVALARVSHTRVRNKPRRAAIARAVDYMDEHYAEDLRIADLVRLTGLSHAQFDRLFHEQMSIPPRAYLLQVRVNHAATLLLGTDKSITTIALEVGFNDSSYFTKAFRRATSMTPRAFRKHAAQRVSARQAAP